MKKHWLQAAERGDAEAQFNLGTMYENGLNDSRYAVEGNRPEAVWRLLAAAEQGLPRAQIKLAEIRRRARDAGKLGKGLRVVFVGDGEPAGRTSREG
jgi:TPR repeat protein